MKNAQDPEEWEGRETLVADPQKIIQFFQWMQETGQQCIAGLDLFLGIALRVIDF